MSKSDSLTSDDDIKNILNLNNYGWYESIKM